MTTERRASTSRRRPSSPSSPISQKNLRVSNDDQHLTSVSRMSYDHHLSPVSTVQPGPEASDLDLSMMDAAYGDFCDLYSDVLRVGVNATHEQIQQAYLDRRADLIGRLDKLDASIPTSNKSPQAILRHRQLLQRRQEALTATVRLLNDPYQRRCYDDALRNARLRNRRRAAQGELPGRHNLNGEIREEGDGNGEEDNEEGDDEYTNEDDNSGAIDEDHDDKDDEDEDEDSDDDDDDDDTEYDRRKSSSRAKRDYKRKTLMRANRKLQREREKERLLQQRYLMDDETTEVRPASAATKKVSNLRRRRQDDDDDDDDDRQDDDTEEEDTLDNTTITGTLTTRDDMTIGESVDDDDDDASVDSLHESNHVMACFTNADRQARNMFQTIKDEISGACEDAMVSVDQVFNAFTLTESDIQAVTKRIDRAKQQLN